MSTFSILNLLWWRGFKGLFSKFSFPSLNTTKAIEFTPREMDVLACVQAGEISDKAIAIRLHLDSPRSAETHVRNIMRKLGSNSRKDIVKFLKKSDGIDQLKIRYQTLPSREALSQQHFESSHISSDDIVRFTFLNPSVKKGILLIGGGSILLLTFGGGFFVYKGASPPLPQIRSELAVPTETVFLKRPHLLKKIQEALNGQKGIQTIALIGPGGAGKTTLARTYAQTQKAQVIWELNTETPQTLKTSFEELAHKLVRAPEDEKILRSLQEIKDPAKKEKEMIGFVRERLHTHPTWILIYDNLDTFRDIKNYFPYDPKLWGQGQVILTTRNPALGTNKHIQADFVVTELTPHEKLLLFLKIMEKGRSLFVSKKTIEEAKKFLQHIPPYPLDVSIAAYYLKATGTSYAAYLDGLQKYSTDFLSVQKDLLKETGDYTKTRYGIIALSLDRLLNVHPEFTDLVLLISLVDSQNIPRDLLYRCKSKKHVVDNFIYNLKKHSFIIAEPTLFSGLGTVFSIHRSTQTVILAYLTHTENLKKNIFLIDRIGTIFGNYLSEGMDEKNFSKCNSLIKHGEMFLSHSKLSRDFTVAFVSGELGKIYREIGNYKKAQQLFKDSLRIYQKNSYKNHVLFAQALANIGNVYREESQYTEAQQFLEESVSIYRKNSYENNLLLAWTLGRLGSVYREQGKYVNSRRAYEESLGIYRRNSCENHADFAWTLGRLGSVYKEAGNYQKAQQFLEESLAIYKKLNLSRHPAFARALAWLGSVYREQGKYDKAQQLLEKNLLIHRELGLESHLWCAWTLVELGNVFREQEKYDKAQQLYEKALVICRENSYEKHTSYARALAGLGIIYIKKGNLRSARDFLEHSLKLHKKMQTQNHTDTARITMNLALLYIVKNDLNIAETLLKKSLKIFRENKNADAYICLEILSDLFLTKSTLARKEEKKVLVRTLKAQAITYLTQALETLKAHFSSDAPHVKRVREKIKALEIAS